MFLDKSVDHLDALEDALQSLSIFCTSVPLSLGYEGEPEISRKEMILYLIEKSRLLNVQFSRIELFVINRYFPPPDPLVQEFLKVKQIHTSGLLSDEEFDDRRILIVERMVQAVAARAYQPPPREVPKPAAPAPAPVRQPTPPPPEPAPAPKPVKSTPKVLPSIVLSPNGGSSSGQPAPQPAKPAALAPTPAPAPAAAPAPVAAPAPKQKEEDAIWFESNRGKVPVSASITSLTLARRLHRLSRPHLQRLHRSLTGPRMAREAWRPPLARLSVRIHLSASLFPPLS